MRFGLLPGRPPGSPLLYTPPFYLRQAARRAASYIVGATLAVALVGELLRSPWCGDCG
ncbi:MAG: hypothetical protein ACR2H5_09605 [Ktedonobacteraceae bacterium]